MEEQKPIAEAIFGEMRKRSLSLERLEVVSGVSERHITAILEGKRDRLPAAPYVRGYIIKIARALELDGEALWKEYAHAGKELRKSGREDRLPETAPLSKKTLLKFLPVIIILALVGIFAITRFFRADNPELEFTNLQEGVTETDTQRFKVEGSIDPAFKLTLGEEEIVPEPDGAFEKEVILAPGFNTFMFAAKKVLGKEHKFPKQIFYDEPEAEFFATTTPQFAPILHEVLE